MPPMQFLTDFADLAMALPLALCVAAWLALSGWRRGAALWLAVLGGLLATMLVLKLAVLGCGPDDVGLASPSGHTATATFLYGGMAALALRPRLPGVFALGLAAAVLFGASRVALHVHSVADVLAGGAAGLLALLLFVWVARAPDARLRPVFLLGACLPVALLLHGLRLTLEPHLREAAHWLAVCRVA